MYRIESSRIATDGLQYKTFWDGNNFTCHLKKAKKYKSKQGAARAITKLVGLGYSHQSASVVPYYL